MCHCKRIYNKSKTTKVEWHWLIYRQQLNRVNFLIKYDAKVYFDTVLTDNVNIITPRLTSD